MPSSDSPTDTNVLTTIIIAIADDENPAVAMWTRASDVDGIGMDNT
jgi:hypothetical protein